MTEDDLLEDLYAVHHRREQPGGTRIRQAFLEAERARLFGRWIGTGKDVLDLGCRDGTLTRHFLDGNRVVGADIDRDALEFARRQYGIEIARVNLNGALPFPGARFDVVLLAETLEHLPYPRITLAEVRRVLRPQGLFVGNVPLFYHLHGRWRVLRGKRLDSDSHALPVFLGRLAARATGGILRGRGGRAAQGALGALFDAPLRSQRGVPLPEVRADHPLTTFRARL